jgi:hypothetical protein
MRFPLSVIAFLVRKLIAPLLSVLVDDFYAMHYQKAGQPECDHHVVDHSLVMSILARYGVGCDLEFAEYSIIRVIEALKAASVRGGR